MDCRYAVLLLLFANLASCAEITHQFKYEKALNKTYLINKTYLNNGESSRNGDGQLEGPDLHTSGDEGALEHKRWQQASLYAGRQLIAPQEAGGYKLRRAYTAAGRRDGQIWVEGVRRPGHCPSLQRGTEKEKIKVVADTNVLISGSLWLGDSRETIKLVEKGKINLLISPEIFNEYCKVLDYPEIIEKVKRKNLEVRLTPSKLASIASIVYPREKVDLIKTDPDDNIILECAREGFADYIIIKDKHLLSLEEFDNAPILTPSEFLERFRKWTKR